MVPGSTKVVASTRAVPKSPLAAALVGVAASNPPGPEATKAPKRVDLDKAATWFPLASTAVAL